MNTVSYFVRYEGEAADMSDFTRYYARLHVPLLQRFPGILDVILHLPQASPDPLPTSGGRAFLMAQMVFASAEALRAALAGPERLAARADMARFPSYEGVVSHQVFTSLGAASGDLASYFGVAY